MKDSAAVGASLEGILCPDSPTACRPISKAGAPTPRVSAATLWIGGKLLVYGGWVFDGAGQPPGPTNTGALYDPVTDRWTPLPTAGAPSPRLSPHVLAVGDRVLVYGGRCGERTGAVLDLASGQWRPMTADGVPPLTIGSHAGGGGARVAGRRALFWLRDAPIDTTTYVYDTDRDTWATLPDPPIPSRLHYGTASTGAHLLIFGGDHLKPRNDGVLLDLATLVWKKTKVIGAPAPRFDPITFFNGTHYVVGGGLRVYIPPTRLPETDGAVYDPAKDTWTALEGEASLDPPSLPPGSITPDGTSLVSLMGDRAFGGPGVILGPRLYGVTALCPERWNTDLGSFAGATLPDLTLRRLRAQACAGLYLAFRDLFPRTKVGAAGGGLLPHDYRKRTAPLTWPIKNAWLIDLQSLNGVWTGDRLIIWGARLIRDTDECRDERGAGEPPAVTRTCVQEQAFLDQGLVLGPY